jgi:hypothetical protein
LGRKKIRHLSAKQFAAVMKLVARMSEQRREAARLGLVEGRTANVIAQQFGWQRTAVNNAETIVWRMHLRYLDAKRAEGIAKG